MIDEVSVGDRREPASGHARTCVGKSVSGALKGQESAARRKKIKISSSDGGPTSDPEIRHTPDFLILLSGGGIRAKRGLRGKKNKISSFGGTGISSLKKSHPSRNLILLGGWRKPGKSVRREQEIKISSFGGAGVSGIRKVAPPSISVLP